jgi:uncharacterized protein (DUF1501 family)
LRSIARAIAAGAEVSVFYTTIGGFDTHSIQVEEGNRTEGTHAILLQTLSDGLKVFHDDLTEMGRAEEVLVMAFSEFGRSLRENSSLGTDHGTANPVFLIGEEVGPGLSGKAPALDPGSLDAAGNMVYSVDFRSVYARVLKWFV